ncbi:hypothetical protein [Corynebacterium aquilae]|uniref:YbjN domain-containing protein n=1 Tax=Corynebacterium aquilae DSM 44791 TaxID=1431546 RepID=A0A1L7CG89_9CORY|nr:hypothetical protein [Corynebacterium aquilae]APT84844.1 hypothetical protein CAQU_06915 [Corynebacterium aquilae DSM 44791]
MTAASEVTMDRVIAAMRAFDVELGEPQSTAVPGAVVTGINLNGFDVHFILMGGYLIVRADKPTGEKTDDANPALFLSCQNVNQGSPLPKSVVIDRTPELIVRSEVEILIGAGMTDEQLGLNLGAAVDGVLEAQQKVAEVRATFATAES